MRFQTQKAFLLNIMATIANANCVLLYRIFSELRQHCIANLSLIFLALFLFQVMVLIFH